MSGDFNAHALFYIWQYNNHCALALKHTITVFKNYPKSRIFSILAFFNNFYPFDSDLSGNTELLS